uniref:F-box domain-containing protein n=1 Tax=Oryza glumipatula TaxID=40148 RepID=A0A0E0AL97_9ORYZ
MASPRQNPAPAPPPPPPVILTDDLLEEIFIRLDTPADLARASASCPPFRRVITDPSFLRRYRALYPPPLLGILPRDADAFLPAEPPHRSAPAAGAVDLSCAFLPDRHTWRRRDVRDGRILFSREEEYYAPDDDGADVLLMDLAVCDPFSGRYAILPEIPQDLIDPLDLEGQSFLCFEPFLAPATAADDDEDEVGGASFRVMYMARGLTKLMAFIFPWEAGEWRAVEYDGWAALINGTSTWLAEMFWRFHVHGNICWLLDWANKLLILDTTTNQLSTIEMVPGSWKKDIVFLETEEGQLGLFVLINNFYTSFDLYYAIWQDNDKGVKQWRVIEAIQLPLNYWYENLLGIDGGYVLLQGIPKGLFASKWIITGLRIFVRVTHHRCRHRAYEMEFYYSAAVRWGIARLAKLRCFRRRRRRAAKPNAATASPAARPAPTPTPKPTPTQPSLAVLSDDVLREIFVRVPSHADLARAATACAGFRRVITEPSFLRRFRAAGHPPALLGFLDAGGGFVPAEPPHPSAAAAAAGAAARDVVDFACPFLPSSPNPWRRRDVLDGRILFSRGAVGGGGGGGGEVDGQGDDPGFMDLAVCDPLSRRYVLLPAVPADLAASAQLHNLLDLQPFFAPPRDDDDDDGGGGGGGGTSFRVMYMARCQSKLVVFTFSSDTQQWSSTSYDGWGILVAATPSQETALTQRHHAHGCIFWFLRWAKKLLVLDTFTMELSTINLPSSELIEIQQVAIVESARGGIGMFAMVDEILDSTFDMFYVVWDPEGANKWPLERLMKLPVEFRYNLVGAAGGYLLVQGISVQGPVQDQVCFTVELKTFKVEMFCETRRTLIGADLFAGFAPSLSPPSGQMDAGLSLDHPSGVLVLFAGMVTSVGKDSTSETAPPRWIELVRRTNAVVTRSISSNLESSSSDLEIEFLPQGSTPSPPESSKSDAWMEAWSCKSDYATLLRLQPTDLAAHAAAAAADGCSGAYRAVRRVGQALAPGAALDLEVGGVEEHQSGNEDGKWSTARSSMRRSLPPSPAASSVGSSPAFPPRKRRRSGRPPPFLGLACYDGFYPATEPHPSAERAIALARKADFEYGFVPWVPEEEAWGWFPLDARDGRVLIQSKYFPDDPDGGDFPRPRFMNYAVCDPLFKRYVMLPPVPDDLTANEGSLVDFGLCLAPSQEDEADTSFRVICVARYSTKLVAFVFSSVTKQWGIGSSSTWSSLGTEEPPNRHGLSCFDCVGGCFYWTVPSADKILVLDALKMEFSVINYAHRVEDGFRACVAVDREGTPGMLTVGEYLGNGEFRFSRIAKQSDGDSPNERLSENIIQLPSYYNKYFTLGAAEGFIFLRGIPEDEKVEDSSSEDLYMDPEEIEYYSLNVKTAEFEMVCAMDMDKCYFDVCPYFRFSPPSAKPFYLILNVAMDEAVLLSPYSCRASVLLGSAGGSKWCCHSVHPDVLEPWTIYHSSHGEIHSTLVSIEKPVPVAVPELSSLFPRPRFMYYAVCDPLFKRYVMLPSIPDELTASERSLVNFALCLAPSQEDEADTSFRVMCVTRYKTKLVVFVFSSVTRQWGIGTSSSWSSLGTEEPPNFLGRFDYVDGCFYWTVPWPDKILVLDGLKMEFSVINYAHRVEDGFRACIAVDREGDPGMLTVGEYLGNGEFRFSRIAKQSDRESPNERLSENTIQLPSYYNKYFTLGAAEGFIFLRGIPEDEKVEDSSSEDLYMEPEEIEYYSLNVKTAEFEMVCAMDLDKEYFSVCPYFRFSPPSAKPCV